MKYLTLLGCVVGALVTAAPATANVPVGDGGATGWVCINGARWTTYQGLPVIFDGRPC